MQWSDIAVSQAGVITRRQLNECGFDADRVRNRLTAGRWRALTPTVLVTTTGPLSDEQRRWAATLQAAPHAPLDGISALHWHGLRSWDRPQIEVVAGKDASVPHRLPGTLIRRSRRDLESLLSRRPGPPSLRVEPAALMHAARCRSEREAHGLLAACVQQRLATADRLLEELRRLSPVRRAESLRACLSQIRDGAGSRAEMDVTDMCRDHGLVAPTRQVRRRDSSGRLRFTDAEWQLPDGRVLILEVDGAFHMDVEHWEADIQRTRRVVDPRVVMVRATSRELRDEPWSVAADLARLGVPYVGGILGVVGVTTRHSAS